ncbi:hypothetical protein Y032_0119g815 [Ancylostoma ceylanicum]|uniref:Uncharacterized protein n=2 Tax=Ancylostoma ceylanicum TaxID=53326 RepID=A0A016TB36_9BILA|nr:hypothetical protein Y032_0119g815 [Ancylostoma ceylanicum]
MWILLALVVTTLAEPLTVEELLTTPMPEKAEELKGKKLVDFVNHRQSSFVAEYSPNAMRYFPLNPVDEEDEDPSTEAPIMKANLYHNAEDSTTLPPLPERYVLIAVIGRSAGL